MAGHLPLYQLERRKEAISKAGLSDKEGSSGMGAGAVRRTMITQNGGVIVNDDVCQGLSLIYSISYLPNKK